MTALDTTALHRARLVLERVTVRALWTQEALKALLDTELVLEREAFLREASESIYYSARYDASENYDSAESFAETLAEELDERLERRDIDGVVHYVLRPFFNPDAMSLNDTRYDRVRQAFFMRDEVEKLLAIERYVAPKPEAVTGLTEHELDIVVRRHLRLALERVNLLRQLRTAMHYARRLLDSKHAARDLLPTSVAPAVEQLEAMSALEGLPEPAKFFGTETDRTNPLKKLPLDFIERLLAPSTTA